MARAKDIRYQTWGQFNSRKAITYLFNGIDQSELKFATKELNPQINLSFNFLIQKYSFHDNPNCYINYSE